MEKNGVKKCWNCARLARCQTLIPCKRFVLYEKFVTIKDVAALCGISERGLERRLSIYGEEAVLRWIKRESGFEFERQELNERARAFVLKNRSGREWIRLKRELWRKKNGRKES